MKKKEKKKEDLLPRISQEWKFPIRSSKDGILYRNFKIILHFLKLFLNMYKYIF